MKGWLQKILKPPVRAQGQRNLPAQKRPGALPAQPRGPQSGPPAALPNATIIYGIGASLLFVAAFFLLIGKHWAPALITLVVGGCLVGYALYFLKHQD
jgi:hypothetical protein